MKFAKILKLFEDEIPVLLLVSRDAHSKKMSFKYMWITRAGDVECKLRSLDGRTEPADYLAVMDSPELKETVEWLIVDGAGSDLTELNSSTGEFAFIYDGHPEHPQVLVLDNMDETITVAVMLEDHVLYSIYLEGESFEDIKGASDAEMHYYVDLIMDSAGRLQVEGKDVLLSSGFGVH